jgi:hypothetical protein
VFLWIFGFIDPAYIHLDMVHMSKKMRRRSGIMPKRKKEGGKKQF